MAVVAVVLTVVAVRVANRPVTPKETTWNEVLVEAEHGGYKIVTTEDFAKQYTKDPGKFLLVDTRQEWEYRTGHIQGAVVFPMDPTWWSRWRRASALETLLGPDKGRLMVFY